MTAGELIRNEKIGNKNNRNEMPENGVGQDQK